MSDYEPNVFGVSGEALEAAADLVRGRHSWYKLERLRDYQKYTLLREALIKLNYLPND